MRTGLPSRAREFVLALLPPGGAFLLQWLFWPFIQPFPWLLFYPAVFISAWIGGFKLGILATIICTASAWWFFIEPRNSFELDSFSSELSIGVFFVMGVMFSILQGTLRAANKKARSALSRLEGMIDSAMDAIITFDQAEHVLMFNAAATKLLGYSAVEAIGAPLDRFIPIRSRASLGKYLEDLRSDQQASPSLQFLGELAALRSNGEEVPIEVSISKTTADEKTLFTAIIRDISERRASEAALRMSEQNLDITLQSIGDAVIATDRDGCITRMNATAERMTGWSLADGRGRKLGAILRLVNDATRQPLTDPARAVLDSKQVVGPTNHTILISDDDREYRISVSAAPIRDRSDDVLGAVLVFTDVTEQYKAQEALRLSEERLQKVIENLSEGLIISNVDGSVLRWNRAAMRMHGYQSEEEVRRALGSFRDIFELSRLDGTMLAFDDWPLARIFRGETVHELQLKIRRLDKSWERVFSYSGEIIDDTRGSRSAFLAIFDVTARRAAQDSQLRTQKMEALGTLAGGIAHDFNNILLAIAGNAKLAMGDLPAGHPVQEFLREIDKASLRATDLVRQILTFSRVQEPKNEVIALRPIIEEALKLLRSSLPAIIELRSEFAANVPAVTADATQIYQVVMNLATNAAHAIGTNRGVIELKLDAVDVDAALAATTVGLHEGRYTRLSIADNGSGMDKATLAKIFDPFFTTRPVGQGTGLGLSVVDGIMKAHNGGVTVSSEPGKGSIFRLYFPAAATSPLAVKSNSNHVPRAHAERIVYVDDDDALVVLTERVLDRMGYKVTGFRDPTSALEKIRADPASVDVVVSDVSMPFMSGFSLAEEILKVRPELPVVLVSGYIRQEDQEAAARIGIRALVQKPDTIDELGQVLDRLFRESASA